jgi:drug/metabolite transporter (DMT)-like permease
LLFAAMCVLWGIPYLLIKVAVAEVSVSVLVFARTALGALVLLPLAARSGAVAVVRAHWRWLLVFAVVEIIGPWALLSDAERLLDSSLTGLLVAAVPIIAVVAGRLAGDRERLGPLRWVGLALGLAGVAVLAAPHLDRGSGLAIGEVMLVAVGYAVGPIIAARRLGEVPNLLMTATCLGFAALVYLVPAALTRPVALPAPEVLFALGGLGLLCTAAAFVLFFELIGEVGPTRAVVFTYVNPAVAVAAGVLLLGEPLTVTVVAAFALILLGSVLATRRRRVRQDRWT